MSRQSMWNGRHADETSFMDRVTTFVLDEVHVFTDDLNVLMCGLRERMRAGKTQRVVAMSAAFREDLWRSYFSLSPDCFHTMIPRPGAVRHL